MRAMGYLNCSKDSNFIMHQIEYVLRNWGFHKILSGYFGT